MVCLYQWMYIYWWQKSFLIIDIQCDISTHRCKNSHLSTLSIYRLSTLSIYRRQIFNVCMVVTLSTRNLPKPGRFYTNFLSYCYSTMVVRNNDPAKTSKLPPLKKILHYIVSEPRRGWSDFTFYAAIHDIFYILIQKHQSQKPKLQHDFIFKSKIIYDLCSYYNTCWTMIWLKSKSTRELRGTFH